MLSLILLLTMRKWIVNNTQIIITHEINLIRGEIFLIQRYLKYVDKILVSEPIESYDPEQYETLNGNENHFFVKRWKHLYKRWWQIYKIGFPYV